MQQWYTNKIAELDKKYQELIEAEKIDEAMAAFKELENYKRMFKNEN